jgi:hypothetical protein
MVCIKRPWQAGEHVHHPYRALAGKQADHFAFPVMGEQAGLLYQPFQMTRVGKCELCTDPELQSQMGGDDTSRIFEKLSGLKCVVDGCTVTVYTDTAAIRQQDMFRSHRHAADCTAGSRPGAAPAYGDGWLVQPLARSVEQSPTPQPFTTQVTAVHPPHRAHNL